jgi:chorismate synthase
VLAYVRQIHDVVAEIPDPTAITPERVETLPDGSPNLVRCPDPAAAARMLERIEEARKHLDSVGGVAEIVATGVPAGLGEPVFDKLKADLAKALFSLPAVLGVELGSGFAGARLRGSEHNDPFLPAEHEPSEGEVPVLRTSTNHHGGILGGISTGMPIVLRAAVKPTSSLPREQDSVDVRGKAVKVRTKGRHDPCVLPRFVPIAEAMVAIVLADHWLRWRGQRALSVGARAPG